jgi:hypothetical protein
MARHQRGPVVQRYERQRKQRPRPPKLLQTVLDLAPLNVHVMLVSRTRLRALCVVCARLQPPALHVHRGRGLSARVTPAPVPPRRSRWAEAPTRGAATGSRLNAFDCKANFSREVLSGLVVDDLRTLAQLAAARRFDRRRRVVLARPNVGILDI